MHPGGEVQRVPHLRADVLGEGYACLLEDRVGVQDLFHGPQAVVGRVLALFPAGGQVPPDQRFERVPAHLEPLRLIAELGEIAGGQDEPFIGPGQPVSAEFRRHLGQKRGMLPDRIQQVDPGVIVEVASQRCEERQGAGQTAGAVRGTDRRPAFGDHRPAAPRHPVNAGARHFGHPFADHPGAIACQGRLTMALVVIRQIPEQRAGQPVTGRLVAHLAGDHVPVETLPGNAPAAFIEANDVVLEVLNVPAVLLGGGADLDPGSPEVGTQRGHRPHVIVSRPGCPVRRQARLVGPEQLVEVMEAFGDARQAMGPEQLHIRQSAADPIGVVPQVDHQAAHGPAVPGHRLLARHAAGLGPGHQGRAFVALLGARVNLHGPGPAMIRVAVHRSVARVRADDDPPAVVDGPQIDGQRLRLPAVGEEQGAALGSGKADRIDDRAEIETFGQLAAGADRGTAIEAEQVLIALRDLAHLLNAGLGRRRQQSRQQDGTPRLDHAWPSTRSIRVARSHSAVRSPRFNSADA